MPLDQTTLAAISGQTVREGMADLGTAISNAAKFREERKKNASQMELRQLQGQALQLGMEKDRYTLAQEKVEDEIEKTNRMLRDDYLKANKGRKIPANATADDFLRMAEDAYANRANKMGDNYLQMAKDAGSPAKAGKKSRLATLQEERAAYEKAGLPDLVAETQATIDTITDPDDKEPQYSEKSFAIAQEKLASFVSSGSEGFAYAVAEQMQNIQRKLMKVTQGMPDISAVRSKIASELEKEEDAYFVNDGWNVLGGDSVNEIKLQEFINDEATFAFIQKELGGDKITRESVEAAAEKDGITFREAVDKLKKDLNLQDVL